MCSAEHACGSTQREWATTHLFHLDEHWHPLMATAPILGLSHLTFIVRDVDRTARLFCEGLGAQEVYDSQGRNFSLSREKFVLLGGLWLAFMEGEPPSERTYRHVAFAVADEDLPACEARLLALGAEVKPPRPRVEGEGQSLYFYDFDNHLFPDGHPNSPAYGHLKLPHLN